MRCRLLWRRSVGNVTASPASSPSGMLLQESVYLWRSFQPPIALSLFIFARITLECCFFFVFLSFLFLGVGEQRKNVINSLQRRLSVRRDAFGDPQGNRGATVGRRQMSGSTPDPVRTQFRPATIIHLRRRRRKRRL